MMNVLVACEESQVVCKAFREKGHNAFSCDIQECSGGHPEWHIQGDVLPLINVQSRYSYSLFTLLTQRALMNNAKVEITEAPWHFSRGFYLCSAKRE